MITRLPPGNMFGNAVKSRQVAGFRLSERIYPPRYTTPKHSHECALLCFVIDGSYTETFGAKTRQCRPSTLLFHPQDEVHAERFHDSGGHSLIVEIEPEALARFHAAGVAAVDRAAEFHDGILALLTRKLFAEFLAGDDYSPLVVEGLILEIIGKASRQLTRPAGTCAPRWLEQVRDLLHARFAARLRLEDIAGTVQVHPVHLAQTFQKHYKCTVGEYVRRLRIEWACSQLATTDTPLADIALAAGFCDQSHFTRTFKRHTGRVPSEFRSSGR